MRAILNSKSTIGMVNANRVNAVSQIFLLPQFCEFFCDSGRILHFKKSVKYSGNLSVNAKMAQFALPAATMPLRVSCNINEILPH